MKVLCFGLSLVWGSVWRFGWNLIFCLSLFVCHPQFFSSLSLHVSCSVYLFVCLLSLVTSWFYLERLHFPSCVYLFLLSLPSLIPWLFSAVFWFPSVSISLITSISWILGFLYFLHVSAKKLLYETKKLFIYIIFHFYDCIELFIYYFMHIILFKVYSTIVNWLKGDLRIITNTMIQLFETQLLFMNSKWVWFTYRKA